MNIRDRRAINIFLKTTKDNHSIFKKVVNGKGAFYFSSFLLILLLIVLLPVSSSVAENIKCSRLPLLMDSFLSYHYAIRDMTEDIRTHAVDQMIKKLDSSKTLFYESDVERLRPVLQKVFENMQTGNCALLKPVYNIIVARARENEIIVKKILESDYRIDETTELNIDVKKRRYAKTMSEKHALLEKFVQFQIENDLLSGIDLAEAKKQQIHRYELQTTRIIKRNPEKLVEYVAEAFAEALDPHTSYLTPENFDELKIQMQLSLEGIGALLSSDNGFIVVEELIPGGSAERSGLLKPKDKIIAVAQKKERPVNVIDMDLHDAVKMIRGKKGTQVTLTILRQLERTYRFDVTILRDRVYIKDQEAKIAYETRMIKERQYCFGVIDLPSFYGDEKEKKSSYEDVKKLLAEAQIRHVDGIVLDLSRNGGGLVEEAVRIAGLFLGNGVIVATKNNREKLMIFVNGSAKINIKDRKNKVITFPAEDSQSVYTGPLVVLTSRLSASASEIVAGALKDYHRAVIIGSDHTFGKGTVQTLSPLPKDLGGMKVTTAMYFLPGGKSTQKIGVEADVRLPGFFNLEEVGETKLEYTLPSQVITPLIDISGNSTPLWRPVERSMLADLAAKSHFRIAKDAKFAEIIKNNKEAARKKGVIRLADLRKEKDKKGGDKKKEKATKLKQKIRNQYAPFISESVNILLDMVIMDMVQASLGAMLTRERCLAYCTLHDNYSCLKFVSDN
ncbi:MAG: PDZ domain-containing protein [Syntrophaceae bacterium]|nr:PDZ domain-containing protein [Syntrophaceae bacterium]